MEQPSSRSASSYQLKSTLRPRVAQRTYSLVHLDDEEGTSMPARIAATLTLKNRPGLPLFRAYLLALLFISPASSLGQTTSHSPGWVVLPVDEYRTLHARAYPIEHDPEPPPVLLARPCSFLARAWTSDSRAASSLRNPNPRRKASGLLTDAETRHSPLLGAGRPRTTAPLSLCECADR